MSSNFANFWHKHTPGNSKQTQLHRLWHQIVIVL